jgi:hypothetical protein
VICDQLDGLVDEAEPLRADLSITVKVISHSG